MRLNTRTDYALRLLLYLQSSGERPASVREIAEAYAISTDHLTKVARELTLRGWIETRRGRHGGLLLAPRALTLTVGDIVRALEQGPPLVECLGDHNTCPIVPACKLQSVLSRALSAFFAVLDDCTLADLAIDDAMMRALLDPLVTHETNDS